MQLAEPQHPEGIDKPTGNCPFKQQKKRPRALFALFVAEQAGFEPAVGYEPTHAFQACDLNHSSTAPCSPQFYTVNKGPSGLNSVGFGGFDHLHSRANERTHLGHVARHDECGGGL